MTNTQATRWRRYGHDRLYIEVDGVRLGYWDFQTATSHPDEPQHDGVIEAAATNWLAAASVASDASTRDTKKIGDASPTVAPPDLSVANDPEPTPTAVHGLSAPPTDGEQIDQVGWDDLANTRAGAAARAQAQALRDAAPVRTILARALGVKTDERAWRIGADGEEAVAAQFEETGGGLACPPRHPGG